MTSHFLTPPPIGTGDIHMHMKPKTTEDWSESFSFLHVLHWPWTFFVKASVQSVGQQRFAKLTTQEALPMWKCQSAY